MSQTNAANASAYLFQGGYLDSNSGLYQFGARWFDSGTGGWISRDPLGLLPDSDPYRFVCNSPNNWTDPSGMAPDGEGWALRRSNQLIFQGRDAEAIRLNEQFMRDNARDAWIMIPAALAAAALGTACAAGAAAAPPISWVWVRSKALRLILQYGSGDRGNNRPPDPNPPPPPPIIGRPQ